MRLVVRGLSSLLYCPKTHATLRSPASSSAPWTLGLSGHIQDASILGDVDAVVSTPSPPGSRLVVQWSGLVQSEGDELYHVRWDNVKGEHVIDLPAGWLVVPGSESRDLDALCRVRPGQADWPGLVSESQYLHQIELK
jgi:hypothetical protein